MAQESEVRRDEVARLVNEVISAILPAVPAEDITGDKHTKDLGADSVDRVEIVLSLIDRFGINEPMSSFSNIPNIDALVDYICKTKQR